jgi:citrate synthase
MAGEGLEDVIAGKSAISTIDGQRGVLTYRGISIHDLADFSTFEETVFLLWFGRLPKAVELRRFCDQIWKEIFLPEPMEQWLKALPNEANPMSLLRTGVSMLGLLDADEDGPNTMEQPSPGVSIIGQLTPEGPGFGPNTPNYRKAVRLVGQMPALVAAIQRHKKNLPFVEPLKGRSVAYNFLYMLNGVEPDDESVKIFDECLVLHADHEFNASTFTARVAAGTLSDLHSAVVAAICALKGPLHGGANTEVMMMLREISDPAQAKEWVKDALAKKKKIMGFGHRLYKTEDPRATHLRRMSEYLCKKVGQAEWYEMSRSIEEAMLEQKNIRPNVDFYSASTYFCLGIDPEIFTPIFALSRISGWTAHILEQLANNRLIRPMAEYIGPANQPYIPLNQR